MGFPQSRILKMDSQFELVDSPVDVQSDNSAMGHPSTETGNKFSMEQLSVAEQQPELKPTQRSRARARQQSEPPARC